MAADLACLGIAARENYSYQMVLTSRSGTAQRISGRWPDASGLDIHSAEHLISSSDKTLPLTGSPTFNRLASAHCLYPWIPGRACEPAKSGRMVARRGQM